MWRLLAVVVATGCRFGFEPISSPGGADGNGGDDGARHDVPSNAGDGPLGDGPFVCAAPACSGTAAFMTCGSVCFGVCAELVDHATAAARCTAWGGELATLHGQADETCIVDLGVADVWIGLEQTPGSPSTGTGWHWHDNSAVDFTSWRPLEPNDQDGFEDDTEDFAQITSGGWNDKAATAMVTYACSRALP
jgi:hypothetical protein